MRLGVGLFDTRQFHQAAHIGQAAIHRARGPDEAIQYLVSLGFFGLHQKQGQGGDLPVSRLNSGTVERGFEGRGRFRGHELRGANSRPDVGGQLAACQFGCQCRLHHGGCALFVGNPCEVARHVGNRCAARVQRVGRQVGAQGFNGFFQPVQAHQDLDHITGRVMRARKSFQPAAGGHQRGIAVARAQGELGGALVGLRVVADARQVKHQRMGLYIVLSLAAQFCQQALVESLCRFARFCLESGIWRGRAASTCGDQGCNGGCNCSFQCGAQTVEKRGLGTHRPIIICGTLCEALHA